jgi:hypothetical protein
MVRLWAAGKQQTKEGFTMKKIRKMDDETFNAMAQLAVLRAVSGRIYELKKFIDSGLDPEGNWIEMDYLRAFCFDGFHLSYISLQEIRGDDPPKTDEFMELRDMFQAVWHSVCDEYQPFVSE